MKPPPTGSQRRAPLTVTPAPSTTIEQERRADDQHGREPADHAVVDPRADGEREQAGERVGALALEEEQRVAVHLERVAARRRVDHDDAERDERHRGEHQHLLGERAPAAPLRHPSRSRCELLDERRGTGRRDPRSRGTGRTTRTPARAAPCPPPRAARAAAASASASEAYRRRHARRRHERAPICIGRLADQVARDDRPCGDGAGERRVVGAPLSEPPRIRWTPWRERAERADRRLLVGRLRVVHVAHAGDLARSRSMRWASGRKARSARSTPARVGARGLGGGRGDEHVLEVVRAAERRAPRRPSSRSSGASARADAHAPRLARESASSGVARDPRVVVTEHRDVVGRPGARTCAASRRRRPRACRGGRGGRASRSAARRRGAAARRRPRAGSSRARRRSTRPPASSPTRPETASPMLPATAQATSLASSIAPIRLVTVDLPFVPVMPTHGCAGPSRRNASSTSLQTGMPRARAAATTGAEPGTPGLLTTRSQPSASSGSSPSTPSTPVGQRRPAARRGRSGGRARAGACGGSPRPRRCPSGRRPTTSTRAASRVRSEPPPRLRVPAPGSCRPRLRTRCTG